MSAGGKIVNTCMRGAENIYMLSAKLGDYCTSKPFSVIRPVSLVVSHAGASTHTSAG